MMLKLKNIKINNKKQKKSYLFLLIIALIGLVVGIFFSVFLGQKDQNLVTKELTDFFDQIENNNLLYTKSFINTILTNALYCIGIWLLGISVIGVPVIIAILFMRGFILGFSISAIIVTYKLKGILGAFLYIFPHHILSIIAYIFLTFYAINFSLKLIKIIFYKKNIDIRLLTKKYLKVLIVCLTFFITEAVFEIYITPILLKVFTNIIN